MLMNTEHVGDTSKPTTLEYFLAAIAIRLFSFFGLTSQLLRVFHRAKYSGYNTLENKSGILLEIIFGKPAVLNFMHTKLLL